MSVPPPPPRRPQRKWTVFHHVAAFTFTGWITVDQAGALWCETTDARQVVFGPGMWIRVESQRQET